jgi:putative ABC transport system ATP-binding protein
MTETTLPERTAPSPQRDRNTQDQNSPGIVAGESPLGDAVITLTGLTKTYTMGEVKVQALENFSTTIRQGDYVAIIGPSGSGKSTLMNLIGLLDTPTAGAYELAGREVSGLSRSQRARVRNQEIGFVFQRFNLLARTQAVKQVELPLFYAGITGGPAHKLAAAALERVGLADRMDHRPEQLSGGQQQRVAIARALVNEPSLLLADEPTGALDSKTAAQIMTLFDELNAQGMTLIVVTHDAKVAAHARRVITLADGRLESDIRNGHANTVSGAGATASPGAGQ